MTTQELAAYLLKVMLAAVPTTEHSGEPTSSVTARYRELSDTIAAVTMDPNEPPLFRGDKGRVRTALLMTSIGRFESNFARGPIHGDCKRVAGKCTAPPKAFCAMQVQPGQGIVLTGELWRYTRPGEKGITGDVLDSDPVACVRTALHMARESIKITGGLGVYTGEGRGGKLAKHRMDYAISLLKKNPVELNKDNET